MRRYIRVLPLLVAVVALALGAAATDGRADDDEDQVSQSSFEHAKIIIEFNSTDSDVGIQAFLGGPSWEVVEIVSPDGRKVFHVDRGSLKELGMNEVSFESEEPSLDDLPLEQLLALFPEGEYKFLGKTVEGDELVSTATLTHDIPDAPHIVSPAEGTVNPNNAAIKWNPVVSPPGIEVPTSPPKSTSFTVPADFLEPGTAYKFEVLAIEVSGNQTITVSSFETE